MSLVTTEPAPITTSSHILTGRIVALLPIETRQLISVELQRSSLPQRGHHLKTSHL